MPCLQPACHSLSMHSSSTTSEHHRGFFRWHHPSRSHPTIAEASVSLRRVFSGVQSAHLWFLACSRMVLRHCPSRHRWSNNPTKRLASREVSHRWVLKIPAASSSRTKIGAFCLIRGRQAPIQNAPFFSQSILPGLLCAVSRFNRLGYLLVFPN
jgi:hypothetical protein